MILRISIKMSLPDDSHRDLAYYQQIDKVFWVIAHDTYDEAGNQLFAQYEKIPCLFVEEDPVQPKILRFDYSIEFDDYRYTAWRKVIGQVYGIRVGVYLLKNEQLYDVKGHQMDFTQFGRSNILVAKKYLGIMDLKE